jgi:hypothetical protein
MVVVGKEMQKCLQLHGRTNWEIIHLIPKKKENNSEMKGERNAFLLDSTEDLKITALMESGFMICTEKIPERKMPSRIDLDLTVPSPEK